MPEALRSLAALVRAGLSARGALMEWPKEAPDQLRSILNRSVRRLALGDSLEGALSSMETELGPDARAVASIFGIATTVGGDVARMLDSLARSIDERLEKEAAAAASSAGAKLSGRMVASLPLLCLPLLPVSRAPLLDPAGILLLLGGTTLAAVGLNWMNRLVPAPDGFDDGAAIVADVASSALVGGAALPNALHAIAQHPPFETEEALRRASRLVKLGMTWTRALERSSHRSLAQLARTLEQAQSKGLPVASSLAAFAAARRAEQARRLDAATRRAPVLMVVPLVVCVLPAFVLLGIGPFIRGLGSG